MFDTHYTTNRFISETREVTKAVHEHKAPTDESIKLLNEMADKALSNIVARWSTDNNVLSMQGAFFDDYSRGSRTLAIKMKLNGKDHKIIVEVDPFQSDVQTFVSLVFDKVSQEITRVVLAPIFNEVSDQITRSFKL